MKRFVFVISMLVLIAGTAYSQVEKRNLSESWRSVSASHHTTVSGWQWKADQWWYKDEATDSVPPSYSVMEEITEMFMENGVETKQRYRITLEVKVEYTTSSPGWKWHAGWWTCYGKEVDMLPPSYECIRTEKKTTVDLDYDTGEILQK